MEFKANGLNVRVDPSELENEQLLGLAQEIADVAHERGLELPFAAGAVAVEGATTTKESFAEQLPAAVQGYEAVLGTLNDGRPEEDRLPVATNETIAAEFEAWFSEDKLAYVHEVQEADPSVHFTLVATPNITVTAEELAKAAKAFGKDQPHETYVEDSFYAQYTTEELSGTNPDNSNAVTFSLIPSADGMYGIVADDLRSQLAALQATHPDTKVPSPLEAVAYWQTLRAGGQLGDGSSEILHFDLPEHDKPDYPGLFGLQVPWSFVNASGQPKLSSDTARNDRYAYVRIALG